MGVAPVNVMTQVIETTIQNASITVTANSTGLDITDFEGIIAVSVRVANVTGTPTDDITVKTSATLGGTYVAVNKTDGTNAAFTQFTAAGAQRILLDCNAMNKFIRLEHVVAGGTPVLNLTGFVSGVKKVV